MKVRLRFLVLFASFALVLPVGVLAHAQESDASQVKRDEEAALDLARLVRPLDSAEIEVRNAKVAFYAEGREDQDLKALEADYPGILDAMWEACEPILRRYSEQEDPALIARLSDLYVARLTRSEIDALIRFYSTPTGEKLVRTMYESADYRPILRASLDDRATTAEDIGEVQKNARGAVLKSVTEADHAALEDLGRSISLTKANALGAEVRQLMASWMNEPDSEMDAAIEAALLPAMEDYMAKATPAE